jgi:hypothetical protein
VSTGVLYSWVIPGLIVAIALAALGRMVMARLMKVSPPRSMACMSSAPPDPPSAYSRVSLFWHSNVRFCIHCARRNNGSRLYPSCRHQVYQRRKRAKSDFNLAMSGTTGTLAPPNLNSHSGAPTATGHGCHGDHDGHTMTSHSDGNSKARKPHQHPSPQQAHSQSQSPTQVTVTSPPRATP